MSQYSWETCPKAIRGQVEELRAALPAILGDNLVGVYLHGSLAMSCFNPSRSDIDLLIVTEHPMPPEAKRQVVELLLRISRDPTPVEVSFLARGHLHPWRYPPPFDLHYGEAWRQRLEEDLRTGAWQRWGDEQRTDVDLAAHITHLTDRGVRLDGPPIEALFPAVPREDYLAAILSDYEDARADILRDPVYGVLNMARVYRYLLEGRLSSKDEAGAWAAETLPEEVDPVVEHVLARYRGDSHVGDIAPERLERFVRVLDERVSPLLPKPSPFGES